MTIKDKAKELAEMYSFEARTNSYCRQCTQQACEMMAHWVVNNACEWLENELQKWVILLTFDEQEQRTAIHNTVERLKKSNGTMISEDYVSFEIAQLLKEKGFNERCRSYYTTGRNVRTALTVVYKTYDCDDMRDSILRPTLQMVLSWLRSRGWYVHIELGYEPTDSWGSAFTFCGYDYDVTQIKTGDMVYANSKETYEEAVCDAIKYILTELI